MSPSGRTGRASTIAIRSPRPDANEPVWVIGPLDREGRLLGDDIAEQTRATMRNLGGILEAAGASFADVVKATIFLSAMDDYHASNEAYRAFVVEPLPARICVAAGGLYHGILVEMDVIAYRGA